MNTFWIYGRVLALAGLSLRERIQPANTAYCGTEAKMAQSMYPIARYGLLPNSRRFSQFFCR